MPTTRSALANMTNNVNITNRGSILPKNDVNKKNIRPREVEFSENVYKKSKHEVETPIKLSKNQKLLPRSPCLTPSTALHGQFATPRTPLNTRIAMRSTHSASKPQRDEEALSLYDITAFKIDAAAFNSYLYMGKAKINPQSSLAREDFATEEGIKNSTNIRLKGIPKRLFSGYSDDEYTDSNQCDLYELDCSETECEENNKSCDRLNKILTHTNSRFSSIIRNNNSKDNDNIKNTPVITNTRQTRSATLNQQNLQQLAVKNRQPTPKMTPMPATTIPRTVNVLIKYPLLGSNDEWEDTSQTCREEVDLYRSIESWRCPYLLRYYGTYGPGIVFEFVDGDAFDTLLDSKVVNPKDTNWVWSELGLHICTALKYLQEKNISHNDLKPSNIRYSKLKNIWKLLDLGLATDLDMKVSKGIGTDGYRAPEIEKTGVIHKKSDVFGLGITLEDAMDNLKRRYSFMSKAAKLYNEVLVIKEEEELNQNHNEEGEIDLVEERVLIFKDLAPHHLLSHADAERLMSSCLLWETCKHLMYDILESCLENNPDDRPSIRRLIHVFQALIPMEKQVREAFNELSQYKMI